MLDSDQVVGRRVRQVDADVQDCVGIVAVEQELGLRERDCADEAVVSIQKVRWKQASVLPAPQVQALVVQVQHLQDVGVISDYELLELRTYCHAERKVEPILLLSRVNPRQFPVQTRLFRT